MQQIGKALITVTKNCNHWFEDENGKILPHFAEVKTGNYTLPCGLTLQGGEIVVYFVEHIFEKRFFGDVTFAVRGLKYGGNCKGTTFIPISILNFNKQQKKAFEVLHPDFPKDFFEVKKELLAQADI